mmetsp:Transcript_69548/g.185498  ORF Transcript_69548/g.185498 Transcript_69548/m.185498 type:complete len:179 (-) Transcript_69548:172-708(-)
MGRILCGIVHFILLMALFAGDFVPTTVQYVNNDILTDCLLPVGFKELTITCGDMSWILKGGASLDTARSKRYRAEPQEGTTAAAIVEIDVCYGDAANPDDLSVTALIIQAGSGAEFLDSVPSVNNEEDTGSRPLGDITFRYGGNVHVASCLPFGRVKAGNGQVFEKVDSWLQSIQRSV